MKQKLRESLNNLKLPSVPKISLKSFKYIQTKISHHDNDIPTKIQIDKIRPKLKCCGCIKYSTGVVLIPIYVLWTVYIKLRITQLYSSILSQGTRSKFDLDPIYQAIILPSINSNSSTQFSSSSVLMQWNIILTIMMLIPTLYATNTFRKHSQRKSDGKSDTSEERYKLIKSLRILLVNEFIYLIIVPLPISQMGLQVGILLQFSFINVCLFGYWNWQFNQIVILTHHNQMIPIVNDTESGQIIGLQIGNNFQNISDNTQQLYKRQTRPDTESSEESGSDSFHQDSQNIRKIEEQESDSSDQDSPQLQKTGAQDKTKTKILQEQGHSMKLNRFEQNDSEKQNSLLELKYKNKEFLESIGDGDSKLDSSNQNTSSNQQQIGRKPMTSNGPNKFQQRLSKRISHIMGFNSSNNKKRESSVNENNLMAKMLSQQKRESLFMKSRRISMALKKTVMANTLARKTRKRALKFQQQKRQSQLEQEILAEKQDLDHIKCQYEEKCEIDGKIHHKPHE